MKFTQKNGAAAGTFLPFLVGDEEITLTSVLLPDTSPGDRIVLKMEIAWDKPPHWDTGELEVILRRDAPSGPLIYWTLESCFLKARYVESETVQAQGGTQLFYLSVRSKEQRARIIGPYSLQGTVYDT
ncbi:hypothetical protein ACFFSY_27170 [Paenibacillus aurantiacus]|uniref:Uncharacterized protein n=1 Tax=Paenibacillus aurantiacus TaxID=1936118 RepID=A0ABV5KWP0_9BACL